VDEAVVEEVVAGEERPAVGDDLAPDPGPDRPPAAGPIVERDRPSADEM
jgi:hypothetical protein